MVHYTTTAQQWPVYTDEWNARKAARDASASLRYYHTPVMVYRHEGKSITKVVSYNRGYTLVDYTG